MPKAEQSKAAFEALHAHKSEIEAVIDAELSWDPLPHRSRCRISRENTEGGWKSPEQQWPALIDWAIGQAILFEKAFKPAIAALKNAA